MDGRDYVGPTALQAAVLPARAVYLVADGSTEGLRRAVQEACTRWGGMTEPIIPVKPDGDVDLSWQRLVTLARADTAVNVDVDPITAAAAAENLGMDASAAGRNRRVGAAAYTVHPSAVGPEQLPGYIPYVIASQKRRLWEVVGAGDLSNQHLESIHEGTFYTRRPHEMRWPARSSRAAR